MGHVKSTRIGARMLAYATGLALLGAVSLGAAASAQPGGGDEGDERVARDVREYVVGPPSNLPEGVVYDERTRAFYGGSAADGTLYKATLDENPAEVFLASGQPDGRTEALGVNVDKEGRLYVAGGGSGRLLVYDIGTREQAAEFRTGPGGYINDVDITRKGDVYFTDSFRPFLYRVTKEQVESGGGEPEAIPLSPEVSYTPVGSSSAKPFNSNGVRETPDGKHIIFADLNDAKLYRLTPKDDPASREIREIKISGGTVGDVDGLEFVGRTLYAVDNGGERVLKVKLSPDYLEGRIESATTSPEFHTPTTLSKAPGNRLLVSNAEFFDASEAGPPYFVTSIPRP